MYEYVNDLNFSHNYVIITVMFYILNFLIFYFRERKKKQSQVTAFKWAEAVQEEYDNKKKIKMRGKEEEEKEFC